MRVSSLSSASDVFGLGDAATVVCLGAELAELTDRWVETWVEPTEVTLLGETPGEAARSSTSWGDTRAASSVLGSSRTSGFFTTGGSG